MTESRCTQCGATALPPPGTVEPQTCRYCGGGVTVTAASAPAGGAGRAGRSVWPTALVVVAVTVAAAWFGLKHLSGPSKAGAVVAGVGNVPVDKLAGPIHVRPVVAQRGRQVYVQVRMTDAAGRVVRSVYLAGESQPPPPEVVVSDAAGAVIHRGRTRYG